MRVFLSTFTSLHNIIGGYLALTSAFHLPNGVLKRTLWHKSSALFFFMVSAMNDLLQWLINMPLGKGIKLNTFVGQIYMVCNIL